MFQLLSIEIMAIGGVKEFCKILLQDWNMINEVKQKLHTIEKTVSLPELSL